MSSMLAFLASPSGAPDSPPPDSTAIMSDTVRGMKRMPPPTMSTVHLDAGSNGQLYTPTSSVSQDRNTSISAATSISGPSSHSHSELRHDLPSPIASSSTHPPTSSSTPSRRDHRYTSSTPQPQPAPSTTQDLFKITQLLLSLDSSTRISIRSNEDKLEKLEDALGNRLRGFGDVLESVKGLLEDERSSREDMRVLMENLSGRVENIERICRSISRSQSALSCPITANNVDRERGRSDTGEGRSESQSNLEMHGTSDTRADGERSGLSFIACNQYDTSQMDRYPSVDDAFTGDHQGQAAENGEEGLFMDIDGDNGFQPADMDVGIGINPQEVMRSPSHSMSTTVQPPTQINGILMDEADQTAKDQGMSSQVAAVISKEIRPTDQGVTLLADDLSETPSQPQAPIYQTRLRRKSTQPQRPQTASPDLSHASSSTAVQQDEDDNRSTSKPPPRLPFPSRVAEELATRSATIPPTQPKKRGRPRLSQPKLAQSLPQVQPILVNSGSSAGSAHAALPSEDDEDDYVKTKGKRRRKSNAKSKAKNENKPSSKRKSDTSNLTKAGTARIRKFKGQVRLAIKCLAPSGGERISEASWPDKGPNTAKGRLEEIVCDACKGRCHWSCAGIPEDKDMSDETWVCPDCTYRIDVEEIPRVLIDCTQQMRCIRYNCILREKRAIEHEEGEEERYFVEKVVGRKAIARDPESQKRIFVYLVKWDGYELYDCTWEPPANLEHHIDKFLADFDKAARRTKSDLKMRVCILPEARKFWDEVTGQPLSADVEEGEGSSAGDGDGGNIGEVDDSENTTTTQESPEKANALILPNEVIGQQINHETIKNTTVRDATNANANGEANGSGSAGQAALSLSIEQTGKGRTVEQEHVGDPEDEDYDELDDDQAGDNPVAVEGGESAGGTGQEKNNNDQNVRQGGNTAGTLDVNEQEGEEEMVDELQDTPEVADGEQDNQKRSFFGLSLF
ncbi:uncharacterized protein I303_103719 [Kwoniella dejecticola CBS 10117]|uniref:Chromo domain-containing protein n=1 Tax=Kwoniella dejecticola CBS 10117 TaxID=1296121 RepID=A0A1A6A7I4_9TREE|nr:uncharacterized protein I303_03736 [Kwoniella dejecticola CBS 10117]OBR86019.1 hypothetical protein I303_03736 [Kwoniella dejecticola CBS 10117]